ncbi:MAG: 5-formyltetrahydrofolate cyclo-ligase [Ilumatobacteraceae bacterium]
MQDKRSLRTSMRTVRAAIAADPVGRHARSARIWSRIVAATGLDATRRVMLFEGLPTEPETDGWFAWCRDHDVAVFAPEVAGPDLRVVSRGTSSPGDGTIGPTLDVTLLDVVVVPGLAFTADGRRLGQGGGHYDRFLPRLRAGCVTVGAAFAEQLVADLPTEPHDVRLDLVVTDA